MSDGDHFTDRAGTFDVEPDHGRQRPLIPLFAYGFRPFFLLASLYAMLVVPAWMAFLQGHGQPARLPALAWHAHEMIYGFVAAAIAGFILTAVPSWTGRRGFAGMPLLGLVSLWLAGRVVFVLPFDSIVVAVVDLAFLPALAFAIVPSLVRSGNRRNFVFVVLLGLLFIANLRFHLDNETSTEALALSVNTILVLVALVGGRVVPAFTSARLKQRGMEVRTPGHALLDRAAIAATLAVLVVDVVSPGATAAGVTAACAALLLGLRLARWHGHRTLGEPILWVLHVAYAWLPVALALKAAWLLGGFAYASGWLHALTIGAFSTMVLAVMSRASLGHTGRPLVAPKSAACAYLLVTAAALTRVFAPALFPGGGFAWIAAAAALWTTAFALFLIAYAPILCMRRADGKPG